MWASQKSLDNTTQPWLQFSLIQFQNHVKCEYIHPGSKVSISERFHQIIYVTLFTFWFLCPTGVSILGFPCCALSRTYLLNSYIYHILCFSYFILLYAYCLYWILLILLWRSDIFGNVKDKSNISKVWGIYTGEKKLMFKFTIGCYLCYTFWALVWLVIIPKTSMPNLKS